MLIKFFPNGKGAGAGPVGYLVAERVLAYDGNRDLIRDANGQPKTVTRDPLPEVLSGNPERTEAVIDASRHQWTYRAGVISFADTDDPTADQQAEVMDQFERLAFAGLDPEQYEVLWVRHAHEGRVELHFLHTASGADDGQEPQHRAARLPRRLRQPAGCDEPAPRLGRSDGCRARAGGAGHHRGPNPRPGSRRAACLDTGPNRPRDDQ
ncbi:relaxase/mobilization nuclease domain-containing protein [Thalassorhabdomicrobium marinisediminis]|uniref:relaxase/mobilization nuclease domain-containing protein n=1 Tax=Thalassorhabdomicrobium marinisediminis TaxID=2170577 RepID=UPI001F543260|nr:relaxase/mobilization nuclease domain-containing protein [Thalassorhabdomicrobium marinisediminis]